jgi:uncharacterized protein (DUF4213/DUF364 family)
MTILQEVIANLPDGIVTDVHLGECWNAVVVDVDGRRSCGMASTPSEAIETTPQPGTPDFTRWIDEFKAHPARDLCRLALDPNLRKASVGVAAINALLPKFPKTYVESNAEAVIAERGRGKRVAMVGHFPCVASMRERVGRLDVLELHPQEGDYPAEAAAEIIPQADVVTITGMTIINGTLEGLLKLCPPSAYVVMMGPSVFLSPVLFDYGVDLLGGSIIEKIDPVLAAIDCGTAEQIFPYGVKMVLMAKEKWNK